MRCSRRRGSPSPFQALLSDAANLVSLASQSPTCRGLGVLKALEEGPRRYLRVYGDNTSRVSR